MALPLVSVSRPLFGPLDYHPIPQSFKLLPRHPLQAAVARRLCCAQNRKPRVGVRTVFAHLTISKRDCWPFGR